MATKVLLVDDDRLLTDGARRSLRGLNVIDRVENAALAESVALDKHPDVVLLDVQMPGLSAWRACRRIVDEARCRVLFWTAGSCQYYLHRAITAGASGIVAKGDQDFGPLISIVRRVAAGDAYYSPAWQRRLDELAASDALTAIERLSLDQIEVMVLLAQGLSKGVVAERLKMHKGTVSRLLSGARELLGCETNEQLLYRAAIEQIVTV